MSGIWTVNGDRWTFAGAGSGDGMAFRQRCLLTYGSGSTSVTAKCDTSTDGKSWMPTWDFKGTKAK